MELQVCFLNSCTKNNFHSNLKKIIISRGISNKVIEEINIQIFDKGNMFDNFIKFYSDKNTEILCICFFLYAMYFYYNNTVTELNNMTPEKIKEEKLRLFKEYSHTQKIVRQIIFIILVIFARDVDNAT